MPNIQTTFPNQRMVKVHRERAKSDFLGIKNENWQAASRGGQTGNWNGKINLPDQFHKLVDKGYLVPSHGNTYAFYEVPQSATQSQNSVPDVGLNFEDCPHSDGDGELHGQGVSAENIEIDNMTNSPDTFGTNKEMKSPEVKPKIEAPRVKEIVISRPVATGRERPVYNPPSKGEFEF